MIGELNPCAASELSHACREKEKRGCASPADVTQISKEAASRNTIHQKQCGKGP